MPGDDGLGLDDDEHVGPARPQPAKRNPEHPIETLQSGPRLLPFEYGELLSKSGRFQRKMMPGHKESAEVGDHREHERNHHSDRKVTELYNVSDTASTAWFLFQRHFDDPQEENASLLCRLGQAPHFARSKRCTVPEGAYGIGNIPAAEADRIYHEAAEFLCSHI
ncbi:MAG: hypothetical protein ACRD7E_18580 [Bryobacteraceae bacterium]